MTSETFKEGSWEIRVTRDEISGKSELEAKVSNDGVQARIFCRETFHFEDADVDVEFITNDGTHIHTEKEHHFHREEQSPTVFSSAAAYMMELIKKIGNNPADYLKKIGLAYS